MSEEPAAERLWGGRFVGAIDPELDRYTASLPFDRRLVVYDLIGSLAHARMLLEQRILDRTDGEAVLSGLAGLLREVESGELVVEGSEEDVHTWIERRLIERAGESGRRLHTARSRNDQTGTALRLYLRATLVERTRDLIELVDLLLERSEEHTETLLPGYTHLQPAQPVTLAHHLMAHAWALLADRARLGRCHELAGQSPLGAAALAGTSHPIDPARSAQLLGLRSVYPNSMWAVADRDYVAEAVFACALLMSHLSRWASEVVLWSSPQFGFLRLHDSVAKGSSLLPQKKNPEAAEILRGKCGRVVGSLTGLLVVLKGLPLTYNSDLQEDKEPLFDALDTAGSSLRAARALLAGVEFLPASMARALGAGYITATDLADALVRRGVPFRSAHEQTGKVVRLAEERQLEIWQLPLDEVRGFCPAATEADLAGLEPADSVRAHASPGGPAPERIREQLAAAREELSAARSWLESLSPPPIYAAYRRGALLEEALL